jgi:putative sterol carrier protein
MNGNYEIQSLKKAFSKKLSENFRNKNKSDNNFKLELSEDEEVISIIDDLKICVNIRLKIINSKLNYVEYQ